MVSRQQLIDEREEEMTTDPTSTCGPADTDHDWLLVDKFDNAFSPVQPYRYEIIEEALRLYPDWWVYTQCAWCAIKRVLEDGKIVTVTRD